MRRIIKIPLILDAARQLFCPQKKSFYFCGLMRDTLNNKSYFSILCRYQQITVTAILKECCCFYYASTSQSVVWKLKVIIVEKGLALFSPWRQNSLHGNRPLRPKETRHSPSRSWFEFRILRLYRKEVLLENSLRSYHNIMFKVFSFNQTCGVFLTKPSYNDHNQSLGKHIRRRVWCCLVPTGR